MDGIIYIGTYIAVCKYEYRGVYECEYRGVYECDFMKYTKEISWSR